jgi:hypothetical protein
MMKNLCWLISIGLTDSTGLKYFTKFAGYDFIMLLQLNDVLDLLKWIKNIIYELHIFKLNQ